jgi:hypothetical protein
MLRKGGVLILDLLKSLFNHFCIPLTALFNRILHTQGPMSRFQHNIPQDAAYTRNVPTCTPASAVGLPSSRPWTSSSPLQLIQNLCSCRMSQASRWVLWPDMHSRCIFQLTELRDMSGYGHLLRRCIDFLHLLGISVMADHHYISCIHTLMLWTHFSSVGQLVCRQPRALTSAGTTIQRLKIAFTF